MPHKDPEQKRAYERAYREAHKDVLHARVVACNRRARHERYAKIQALKVASPCLDCGKSFPYVVMDFDHRDPSTKVAEVPVLVKNGAAWDRVLEEIAKCDLVCACCHRLRTYKGDTNFRSRRYQHHRAALDKLKGSTPCLDCGGSFKPAQMDFDHLGGKVANIAQLVGGTTEALLEELGKCHLVCANCHRVRGHEGVRPEAPGHTLELVRRAKALLETSVPEDKRVVAFPFPDLLGRVPDKELAVTTGLSREMVAWHRRKAGIVLTRQGERVQP